VKYLKHYEIDYKRWDNCIEHAYNSLVYAKSWYLNIVSPGWEALIFDDYMTVMPLPKKKKYGISYCVQPILTQQLGIFSKTEIDETTLQQCITNIPYWSYCINLNSENYVNNAHAFPNYELSLQKNYDDLFYSFSHNTQRNIAKAKKSEIVIKDTLKPNEFLDFYFSTEKKYCAPQTTITSSLIIAGFERKELSLWGAYNTENTLIAALCLLHSKNRLIYLLPVSCVEGKTTLAMFAIINEVIKKYSEENYVFDFEGSRIESIARFYRGFGATLQPYYQIRRMRPKIIFG
jgi:hypothetical protein